jgi:hypothetical protein
MGSPVDMPHHVRQSVGFCLTLQRRQIKPLGIILNGFAIRQARFKRLLRQTAVANTRKLRHGLSK